MTDTKSIENSYICDIQHAIDTYVRSPDTWVEFVVYEGERLLETYQWHTTADPMDALDHLVTILREQVNDVNALEIYYAPISVWG